MFRLDGKVSLVTGGSRGLGYGIAKGLAQAGSNLVLVSRSRDELNRAAEGLTSETGRKVLTRCADVSELTGLDELVNSALSEIGQIDILVNNAGVQVRKPFLEIVPDEFDLVLSTNLRAVFFLTQLVARSMIDRGVCGKIINISSLTSVIGVHNISAYGAAKGGVCALTKSMAVELAPHGINVNAIAPGYFRTQMTEAAFEDEARSAWISARIPLGRSGCPEDLAGTAVFLASDASSYLTGSVIFVDGGWISA